MDEYGAPPKQSRLAALIYQGFTYRTRTWTMNDFVKVYPGNSPIAIRRALNLLARACRVARKRKGRYISWMAFELPESFSLLEKSSRTFVDVELMRMGGIDDGVVSNKLAFRAQNGTATTNVTGVKRAGVKCSKRTAQRRMAKFERMGIVRRLPDNDRGRNGTKTHEVVVNWTTAERFEVGDDAFRPKLQPLSRNDLCFDEADDKLINGICYSSSSLRSDSFVPTILFGSRCSPFEENAENESVSVLGGRPTEIPKPSAIPGMATLVQKSRLISSDRQQRCRKNVDDKLINGGGAGIRQQELESYSFANLSNTPWMSPS
jgi:hypothetical protein